MKTYTFDGEQLTTAEIHQRIPVIPLRTIQRRLSEGVNTKVGMLCHDPKAGMRKGGKKSAKVNRGYGYSL